MSYLEERGERGGGGKKGDLACELGCEREREKAGQDK